MRMKHNISITMDSRLFREIENTRGREKRSTFIEHLIRLGLKAYKNKKEENAASAHKAPALRLTVPTISQSES
jgi:metal-responsive CopG/Arc/MetJ family transcriptional regulator